MKVNRKEFLNTLTAAISGTSKMEILEQSNCFIFTKEGITAFNGEIYATIKYSFPWEFAVVADDLIQVISKFPDEEIKLDMKKNQLIIAGKKKRAGLTVQNEILLPVNDLPESGKMKKVPEGLMDNLLMASKICQVNNENYKVSHVYVTKDQIVSTDRYKFMRIKMDTGIKRLLVPASALLSLSRIKVTGISVNKGWLFLSSKTNKSIYAICCTQEEYVNKDMINDILDIEDGATIQFPKEMKNVVDRALVMAKDDIHKLAKVSLTETSIVIRTQKENGWYEEKQPVKFKGKDMKILISLPLLKELLERTSKAKMTETKIKMEKGQMEFVVALGE